jgi:Short C-terminal domain
VTAFGAVERSPVPIRGAAAYLLGIAGLTFSLTVIWLTMRAVMGIGGACASGGPYVPAVECPDAVVVLMPVSMFGLFLFGGLAAWGGAALGGSWLALIALGWPALFLSLGWNFLEFGLRPPGGEPGEVVWSWLFCAVVFGLMGGVPLVVGLWGLRAANATPRAYAGGRIAISPRGGLEAMRQVGGALVGAERVNVLRHAEPDPDVTARLERLARLRAAGDLTDAEFDAAKRATLDEARH